MVIEEYVPTIFLGFNCIFLKKRLIKVFVELIIELPLPNFRQKKLG